MILQLPSILDRSQIEAVVSILDQAVPSSVKKGIQFIQGGHGELVKPSKLELEDKVKLIRDSIPSDYNLELHAPICPHDPSQDLNLAYSKSLDRLRYSVDLAEKMGAKALIVHPNTVYRASLKPGNPSWSLWDRRHNDWAVMRREIREPMYSNLESLAKSTSLVIGVENMPTPLNTNKGATGKDIHFEPNMVTYEDLVEFCERTQNIPNLKVVYDTAHALLAKGTLSILKDLGVTSSSELLATPYRGIYPEHFSDQPSIDQWAKMLSEKGKLGSIQLASAGKIWVDGKQLSEEGESLDGPHYPVLLNVAKIAQASSHPVPLSLDLGEKDYLGRPNQRRAIERIVRDLNLAA